MQQCTLILSWKFYPGNSSMPVHRASTQSFSQLHNIPLFEWTRFIEPIASVCTCWLLPTSCNYKHCCCGSHCLYACLCVLHPGGIFAKYIPRIRIGGWKKKKKEINNSCVKCCQISLHKDYIPLVIGRRPVYSERSQNVLCRLNFFFFFFCQIW